MNDGRGRQVDIAGHHILYLGLKRPGGLDRLKLKSSAANAQNVQAVHQLLQRHAFVNNRQSAFRGLVNLDIRSGAVAVSPASANSPSCET